MPKKKESIYLETSVISAYFDFKKQDTERKKITRNFWHKFKAKYTFVISEAVTMELEVKKEYRSQFLEVIKEIKELRITNKLERLADRYIKAKIIRPGKYLDALHLACTTIYKIDHLISWNYKDLVGSASRKKIIDFNNKRDLHISIISTPQDFLEGEL